MEYDAFDPMTHNPPPDVPDFAPVEGRPRVDGWTPEKQRRFLEHLADKGSVNDAAALVGMSRESAYRLRRRRDAADFNHAWEAALQVSSRRLIDIAFDRAVNGVSTPVFFRGDQIGERRTYSDKLLMFLLRHYAPHRFDFGPRSPSYDPRRPSFRGLPLLLNKILKRGRTR